MHFRLSSNYCLAISLADSAYTTSGNTNMSELGLFISNSYRLSLGVLITSGIQEHTRVVTGLGLSLALLSWHAGHYPYDHELSEMDFVILLFKFI